MKFWTPWHHSQLFRLTLYSYAQHGTAQTKGCLALIITLWAQGMVRLGWLGDVELRQSQAELRQPKGASLHVNLFTVTSQISVADILPSFALRYLLPSSSFT